MKKKIKPVYAFAAYNPAWGFGLNPYWIRAHAKTVRNESQLGWDRLKKDGWKVVKVKVSVVQP